MERGSDKHGFRLDGQLKHETEGLVRSGRDTRAEQWKSAEPSGEDQPDVDLVPDGTLAGGTPDGIDETDVEGRSELATYLPRSAFPAVGELLMEVARKAHAPDRVLDRIRLLPSGREFVNVQDVWSALGRGAEQHRF